LRSQAGTLMFEGHFREGKVIPNVQPAAVVHSPGHHPRKLQRRNSTLGDAIGTNSALRKSCKGPTLPDP
jgi:hypothetical protein